ncbi:PREDICTED: 26S proteasome complex subunit DSS1 [Nipponia nippon]|uniref:26S proteasome complex subunit DSS1 n=1 Tax=Nipponia nippon TaxID=128390 RepID=UPI00051128B5|nr:PREDICTED: 26S proteasome complex subunit DSS1 [Nipponia nippon]
MGLGPPKGLSIINCITKFLDAVMLCGIRRCLFSVEENWTGLDEDEDAHVWEDNWDDDNVEDDFSNQLRAELEKHGYKMETS